MVKLYVVIVGLFAIIPPRTNPGNMLALLVNVEEGARASDGVAIHPHSPIVTFRVGGEELTTWFLEGEDVKFYPNVASSPTFNSGPFARLEDVLGNANMAVAMDGCVGQRPQTECLTDGKPVLAGRVALSGGRVLPLDVRDPDHISMDDIPRDVVGFRSLRDPDTKSPHIEAAANGILFEADVTLGQARIDIGSNYFTLQLSPEVDCRELTNHREGRCIIVEVKNLSGMRIDRREPDRHFELIYRLLSNQGGPRLVPYIRSFSAREGSDPPSVRCIPPVLR